MWFDFNYIRFIQWKLPTATLKPKMLAGLSVLFTGFKTLHGKFVGHVATTDFELLMSGQVCRLRWGLNTKFDATLKRFIVRDATASTQVWTFQEVENKPVYMPFFISGGSYDFEVQMPASLQPQEIAIRNFIDRHKLPGKRYIIIYL